jgi:nicotinamide phosphoribosyltransferase
VSGVNPFLDKDSYKLSHPALYPAGIKGMSAYIEARKPDTITTFFGLQIFLRKWPRATKEHFLEAKEFATQHGEPFPEAQYQKLLDVYGGFPPIRIYAVPEGTRVPSLNALVRIECEDDDLFWMAMDCETALQRAVWYPTTIASNDLKHWRLLQRYWRQSSIAPEAGINFMLHDFGGRGVSSEETAQIGGAAHLVYFMGSDTISGVLAANRHYNGGAMSAFSVPASEHSVQCSYGPLRQQEYLQKVLDVYAKPKAIVSLVIDGYDTLREAQALCSEPLRDQIKASGATVVFRPDSGDPCIIVPQLLRLQEAAFGATKNTKGFKVINHVKVIQGDGVDIETMESVLMHVLEAGYSAENIVFGSGGALLQKVNRDTYGFAQKASAIKVDGVWRGIHKAPITDPGKNSKSGRLTLLRSKMNGEFMTAQAGMSYAAEWTNVMEPVWDTGRLLRTQTLTDIRERAMS